MPKINFLTVDPQAWLFSTNVTKSEGGADIESDDSLRGTVFATENTLQKISGATSIDEWLDYGGEPGFLRITTTEFKNRDVLEAWLRVINQEKNVRSWLDYVTINNDETFNLYIGSFDFSEGEVTLPTAFEDGLAFSNLYIGMADFSEGHTTVPPFVDDAPINHESNLIHEVMNVPIASISSTGGNAYVKLLIENTNVDTTFQMRGKFHYQRSPHYEYRRRSRFYSR